MKNELEFKNLKIFDFKALAEPGTFGGYAGIFNNRDEYGDKSMPGMFTKTLKEKNNKVIFLDNHDENKRLGYGILVEDNKGLKIDKGVINLKTSRGVEAWEELKFYLDADMPMGASYGYWTVKADYETEKDGSTTRLLREVKLRDFAMATIPGNKKATITSVKSLIDGLTPDDARVILNEVKTLLGPDEIKALLLKEAAEEPPVDPPPPGHESKVVKVNADWLVNQIEELKNLRRS